MFITSIKFVQTIRAQVINLHRTNEKYQYQTVLLNAYQKKRQKENYTNKKEIMMYKSLNYIKLDPFLIILNLNTMQNSR